MKITSDLTNLTTAILILTVQMFFEWTLPIIPKQLSVSKSSIKVVRIALKWKIKKLDLHYVPTAYPNLR
jgi:hypothetical protein